MGAGIPFLLTVEFNGGPELLRPAARLQLTARKYGFKPVWLVGVEALKHPEVLEPLVRWQRDGEAEAGGLLDPAAVPPVVDLGPLTEGRRPFLTDFPESVMEEKVTWFAANLEAALGRRAVTVRSARASVDDRYYTLLAKHGFKVDLTVVPHAKIDTSDFTGYSEKPYLTPQGIFEVPRTVRRHKYGPFIEDLLVLPSVAGRAARLFFPILRCFRLRQGNTAVVRYLVREAVKTPPEHLDLRIGVRDWSRGERLLRDLERTLASVQTEVHPLTAEEFYLLFKNEQLRKGLV